MKTILFLGAATAVLLSFSTAFAESDQQVIAGADQVDYFDWTGFYAGVHGGYGVANYRGLFDGNGGLNNAGYAEDLVLGGIAGGFQAGANWQMGEFVLGIEGDVTFADWSDTALERDGNNSDDIEGQVNLLASLRGRVGMAYDRSLLFATAGLALGQATYTANNGPVGSPTSSGTVNFNSLGVAIGAGVEMAATDNILLRFEGIAYIFNDNVDTSSLNSDSDAGDFAEFSNAFVIRAGASIKMN